MNFRTIVSESNVIKSLHYPLIEQNSCKIPVLRKATQSAFSQRPQSVTVTTKRLDEVQTVNNPLRDDPRHSSKSSTTKEQIPSTSTLAKVSSSKKSQPERKSSVTKIQMSSSTGQMSSPLLPTASGSSKAVRESNYTPSISSIGSVLLRSKTADFEKILSDQKKKSRISANAPPQKIALNAQSIHSKAQQPNPNVANINISLKTGSKQKSEDSEKRMPIYKRQEIISSVQKT